MPRARSGGDEIAYEVAGSGAGPPDADGEPAPVAFVPTLGFGPWQWGWQVPAIAGPFRTIATATRGTAGSAPPTEDVDVGTLASDLEAVLADAGARSAHLVAHGLGGHVALEYARRYGRARSLTLVGTTPGGPEATPPAGVLEQLYAPPADDAALERSLSAALSPAFRAAHPDVVEGIVEWRAAEDADRSAWAALAGPFEDWDRGWPLYDVSVPALVVHGGADAVVPPANAEVLAERLPRAESLSFPEAGHLVTVERSRPLNDRLVDFLERHADLKRE